MHTFATYTWISPILLHRFGVLHKFKNIVPMSCRITPNPFVNCNVSEQMTLLIGGHSLDDRLLKNLVPSTFSSASIMVIGPILEKRKTKTKTRHTRFTYSQHFCDSLQSFYFYPLHTLFSFSLPLKTYYVSPYSFNSYLSHGDLIDMYKTCLPCITPLCNNSTTTSYSWNNLNVHLLKCDSKISEKNYMWPPHIIMFQKK